ncbi:MAG: hypothetical protein RLZZ230_528 [Candidatus Parcubacteria bacterium]|jgi:phosphodiesterase/alkaline phosphatase D-like protein
MNTIKKYATGLTLGVMFLSAFIPLTTQAATTVATYQPRTQAEMVAYLYGRISQLLEIQQSLSKSGNSVVTSSMLSYVTISTYRASDITEKSAVLRGEAVIVGKTTASIWFEYGEDEYFLDQKTAKKTVASLYDRGVRITVNNLKDDKHYYFRIAALDKNGIVTYGETYTFRTHELKNAK